MKLTARGKWYRRVPIYMEGPNGLVRIPLVLLANGHPGYIINQWMYQLVEDEISASKLDVYVRALEHLYAFTMARHESRSLSKAEQESLVASFIDAKRYGTDKFCITEKPHLQYLKTIGLHWEREVADTGIKRAVAAINEFDKWQATFHGAKLLNPAEVAFMSEWEIYQDFKTRVNWDPLSHLHSARTHERTEHEVAVTPKHRHKRFARKKPKTSKGFPAQHLLKLFDCARNPRDELLILLMAGGSLRKSEPLHLFRSDIESINEWGELKVRLADCRTGLAEWVTPDGKSRSGEREVYFAERWKNKALPRSHPLCDLRPRDTYGLGDPLRAGFKGMSFSDSDGGNVFGTDPLGRPYDVNYIFWLDPRVGARAQIAYEAYRNKCLNHNYYTGEPRPEGWLRHPWLFINLDKDEKTYGRPMSYAALNRLWLNLLDRLASDYGIDLRGKRLGWHSLRHFYGWYCASVLMQSIEKTSAMLHHASILSTQKYFTMSAISAREGINKGFLKSLGYGEDDVNFIIKPNTPKIEFPGDWMNNQLVRQMLAIEQKMGNRRTLK